MSITGFHVDGQACYAVYCAQPHRPPLGVLEDETYPYVKAEDVTEPSRPGDLFQRPPLTTALHGGLVRLQEAIAKAEEDAKAKPQITAEQMVRMAESWREFADSSQRLVAGIAPAVAAFTAAWRQSAITFANEVNKIMKEGE